MNNIFERLNEIDWDFSDYISSSYSNDINSIHWYPASFVPQIPAILAQVLSEEGDVILDPFVGSGTSLIETIKLNRKAIGVDLNPNAIEISRAKVKSIMYADNAWGKMEVDNINNLSISKNTSELIGKNFIDNEVIKWFEPQTLKELITIHEYILNTKDELIDIRKIIFSSILNKCCSQRDHYTYITDRCYPKELIYINAISKYKIQVEDVVKSANFFREQYFRLYSKPFNDTNILLKNSNSKDLRYLEDSSVDLIITSPPYLGVNDYIRASRLTSLFFPIENLDFLLNDEIGARRKRHRKSIFVDYINEMKSVFYELNRVLKPNKYFCLIIGQSSGKVTKENLINILIEVLTKELDFELLFKKPRKFKFRRIQVTGIGSEWIIVLKSKKY